MSQPDESSTAAPTDKNYKVYIEMDDVDDGRGDDDVICGSTMVRGASTCGRFGCLDLICHGGTDV